MWRNRVPRKILKKLVPLLLSSIAFLFWWPIRRTRDSRSCLGYQIPPELHSATKDFIEAKLHHRKVESTNVLLNTNAYVFYATDPYYACSVLVNIHRLRNIFNSTERIVVIVKPNLESLFLDSFVDYNATVIPHEPPAPFGYFDGYYEDGLLKLISFRLHQYIPTIQRALFLDSDQLILQPLDHLFSLPKTDITAPRAYWTGDPAAVTSAMMLIQPSDRLWSKVEAAIDHLESYKYDMDIINDLFKNTAMILPGSYCTLNSHWELNELPNWWQGMEQQDLVQGTAFSNEQQTIVSPNDLLGDQSRGKATQKQMPKDAPHRERVHPKPNKSEAEKAIEDSIERQRLRERGARLKEPLQNLYGNDVKVLHFTAMGKPWSYNQTTILKERPDAHPLFAEQFKLWSTTAKSICPGFEDLDI